MLQLTAHVVPVVGVMLSVFLFDIVTWLLIATAVLGMILLNWCTWLPDATGNAHHEGAYAVVLFFTVVSIAVPLVSITLLAVLYGWVPAVVAGVLCLAWAAISAFSPGGASSVGKPAPS